MRIFRKCSALKRKNEVLEIVVNRAHVLEFSPSFIHFWTCTWGTKEMVGLS